MRFNKSELEQMSKQILIKHIDDLYLELDSKEVANNNKSKGAIYFAGAPEYVKKFHNDSLRRSKEVKND